MFLLDISVMIPIADESHVHHEKCRTWFENNFKLGWATCPIIENGFVRILSHPGYGGGALSSGAAVDLLGRLRDMEGFRFVPDDGSIADKGFLQAIQLKNSKHVTDAYLIALCHRHQLRFTTRDQRLASIEVGSFKSVIELIV